MSTKTEKIGNTVRLQIDYNPSVEAKDFIEDPVFASGYFGPLGCGKTTAGTMKAFSYAQAWPGARIAVIRDTYPNLTDTTQKTFFEWLPEGAAGEYARSTKNFYLRTNDPNKPAEIMFRAMDQKDDVTNILSMDLAAAWIDEPQGGLNLSSSRLTKEPGIDHELFLLLQARVGRQKGYAPMLWLTGNPPAPSHWIAKDFGYEGRGSPKNPYDDFHLYLGTKDSNRHNLTPGYYERLERIFGKDTPLARRFLEGEWIEFAQMNPFHRAWIQYYGENEENKLPDNLVIEMGFDPAISDNDSSAMSAIVVAGQCRDGNERGRIYILHSEAGHWSVYEQVERIGTLARQYKARAVRVEDVAYQRALKDVLEHELRLRGINNLYIDLVKPDGDKLRRANSWSALVEDGTVVFNRDQVALIDCMISVPGDRMAWDLVDAAGICVRGFPRLQGERSLIKEPQHRERARSYAVGRAPNIQLTFTPSKHKKTDSIRRARTYFKKALV